MSNSILMSEKPTGSGLVLHAATAYDVLVWVATLGREGALREKMLRPARLAPGESVLDVGCGTGTLAIAAKRQVGPTGKVFGVDASPDMIARAAKKARAAAVEILFRNALAQALPFADAELDVVLSTIMLHHLPRTARQELAREAARVLKPGGRVLIIDFAERQRKSFLDHFHHRHGHVKSEEIVSVVSEAGLEVTGSGEVGTRRLYFVLARKPCCGR